jgi:hypothetical protein
MTRYESDDWTPPAEAWQVEAPVLQTAAIERLRAAALELDEDEIIELSVKPSLWYIPLASARTVLSMVGLGGLTWWLGNHGDTNAGALIWCLLIAVTVARVAWAALTWASRHYVLTNRRVMRYTGVLRADVIACPLRRVRQVRLEPNAPAVGLGLGRVRILSEHDPARLVLWDFLARPDEIYPIVARAVKRSQNEA